MNTEVDTRYTQNRELSWLRFNQRVLEEARDAAVPLMERMKFVEIFTNNLDEFFMVRVGSLTDMTLLKQTHVDNKSGDTPAQQLEAIFRACPPLYHQRDKVFSQLENQLRTCNICRMDVNALEGKARKQVEHWFREDILPLLSPQVIDMHHPFPHLPSKSLNIALALKVDGHTSFGIIPVPQDLPSFLRLEGTGIRFVLLEDVLLAYADQVFQAVEVTQKAVISVTRNADIAPEDEAYDVDEDYRQLMKKVVKKRTRLAPVRLEIQGSASPVLEDFLCQKLNLSSVQVFYSKAPLKLDYVYSVIDLLPPESAAALCEPPYTPRWPVSLRQNERLIPQILRRDVLLFYPYDSMEPFLQLVREAAGDPCVRSIKITIYRLDSKTKLVEYLCAAAEDGKDVTVVMELRARFDEQNNIQWAERMEEAGCTVLYGSEGIKVHSKICQITRKERGQLQYITQVGTGNYNEKTAKLYTDLSLITADPVIGADGAVLFQNIATVNLKGHYQKLLVSPFQLRDRVMALIDGEIAKGSEGYIFLKLNSLTDRKLIDKLAAASQAGVKIVMNIRGICCLRPGVPGLTENITVFSIVGRYLEHSRIYCFGWDRSTAALYISSADFMTRNTERRVEIACPVEDETTRRKLFAIMDELMADNEKARVMDSAGEYHHVKTSQPPRRCQLRFMQNPLDVPPPEEPRRQRRRQRLLHWFVTLVSGRKGKDLKK